MTTAAQADRYIGAPEIAARLGITRNHAWRLLNNGEFGPVTDIATYGASKAQLRIRESQLEEWLAGRTVKITRRSA